MTDDTKEKPPARPESAKRKTARTPRKPVARKRTKRSASPPVVETPQTKRSPVLYDPRYCEMIIDYFSVELTHTVVVEKEVKGKDGKPLKLRKKIQVPSELPTLVGFCCSIGIHRQRLWEWAKVYPELADAINIAKDHQARVLIGNSLLGRYNPLFAAKAAANLLGWVDRTPDAKDKPPEAEGDTSWRGTTKKNLGASFAAVRERVEKKMAVAAS